MADSMESILADGRVMELMQSLEAADKSLGGQVKRFFRSICNLLKRTIHAYSNVKPDSTEGRLVQQMQDLHDQLQQVFAEGIYEGGDNFRKAEKNTTAEGGVRFMARENTEIPYQQYIKLLNKKPIKNASKYYAKVKDARIDRYRTISEDDIPDIDFLEIAEYNKVDEGYVYTIRNYNRNGFAILGRKAIKTKYDGYVMEVASSGNVSETVGKRNDGQRAKSEGHETINRLPGEQGAIRRDVSGSKKTENIDQKWSFGDSDSDSRGRGLKNSDEEIIGTKSGDNAKSSTRKGESGKILAVAQQENLMDGLNSSERSVLESFNRAQEELKAQAAEKAKQEKILSDLKKEGKERSAEASKAKSRIGILQKQMERTTQKLIDYEAMDSVKSVVEKVRPAAERFLSAKRKADAEAQQAQARVDTVYAQAKKALGDKQTPGQNHSVKVTDGVDVKNDRVQRDSYRLAQRIAPGIQAQITVYNGGTEWGYYDHGTDSIMINANARWNGASMMTFTMGHELAHRAKKGSPKKFRAFAQFLVEQYSKQGADLETMIGEQMAAAENAGIEMGYDEAFEEVVADACQQMLLDTDAGKKLALWGAQSAENKGFLAQLKKIIQNLLNRLRHALRNVEPDSMAAREFAKIEANAKKILADMFVDMSIDAGEKLGTIRGAGLLNKITASEGGRQYKLGIMTQAEIQSVQAIGRKSVNAFTPADIKATERLAAEYWSKMNTKSPFFRSWFGDWRVGDQTLVNVATKKGDTRVDHTNRDTGWVIRNSGKVHDETRTHKSAKNREAVPYLPYIDEIIENAVLLDTEGVGKKKSENSLLMHYLYAVADIGHGPEVLKLHVEEMYNPGSQDSGMRAYSLQNIEKAFAVRGRVQGKTLAPALTQQMLSVL